MDTANQNKSLSSLRAMTSEHLMLEHKPRRPFWIDIMLIMVTIVLVPTLLVVSAVFDPKGHNAEEKPQYRTPAPAAVKPTAPTPQSAAPATISSSGAKPALKSEAKPAAKYSALINRSRRDQVTEQALLAHDLALAGRFCESATTLNTILERHRGNATLRIATIFACMRIKQYSRAKQLCHDGIHLSSTKSDARFFSHLLNDIPSTEVATSAIASTH